MNIPKVKCSLKTLFNIVEAPLKKLLNFDICVVYDDVHADSK